MTTMQASTVRAPRLSRDRVRAMVLTAPGVNCDRETLHACRMAGAGAEAVHLNALLDGRRTIGEYDLLVLAGGFSYGDHLGAGAMLATVLRHRFMDDLEGFVAGGRPVLGICNGFQVLSRLGLLGGVSLAPNVSGEFVCRWVRLRVEPSPCIFLQGLDLLDLPVAHGEGRIVADKDTLQSLDDLSPLRYVDNPNGSAHDIAGLCNPRGNVFGLMPHPERATRALHHPHWQRGERNSGSEPAGLQIFRNAVVYARRLT